ncbi:hypothetical protein JR316_0004151 [Psilocybe cubensis]|uniref:Uncharacterized protein n=3 Tax=Psilocybe cubensis TaxID=181762 RepID=A0A8H7XVV0_PSICU|nr:hypothetical protein JR316_0004146 [Psilocybe cubensis]XP_047749681.1 hypothetical protein JR316_0004151 [Psilocybe cubensis]KAH9482051.1 hypothetical protein JR316_0004146 [Psilocybe cubensis]KAH9482056.1 hypothetical protein JR316_0004151 [Psilocybe cubensis]
MVIVYPTWLFTGHPPPPLHRHPLRQCIAMWPSMYNRKNSPKTHIAHFPPSLINPRHYRQPSLWSLVNDEQPFLFLSAWYSTSIVIKAQALRPQQRSSLYDLADGQFLIKSESLRLNLAFGLVLDIDCEKDAQLIPRLETLLIQYPQHLLSLDLFRTHTGSIVAHYLLAIVFTNCHIVPDKELTRPLGTNTASRQLLTIETPRTSILLSASYCSTLIALNTLPIRYP